MADENKIRQRIELEGEKQYNAALKEAQRNLKVLRSELKAETAELGKNATEQQKAETRTKNLQKQIKEQEKIVRTYEQALKEVKEKYGDNEEAVAQWEVKLNNARTALANMKNGLEDVSTGLKDVGNSAEQSVKSTGNLSAALEKVGSVGETISGKLESAFTTVLSTIQNVITGLWDQAIEIGAQANNWTDLATMFGTSTTKIEQWDNMLKSAGKDFSTLGSIMNRVSRGKNDEGITEWLGVSHENYTDDLEYTLAIMEALYEKREQMGNSPDFNKQLNTYFKGNYDDILWMISNWDYLMGRSDKYDAEGGGFGITDEQIAKMNEFYLRVNDVQTSWEALKKMAFVELFGDVSLKISGNLQAIVEALKEYFQATSQEEKDAAKKKITDNLVEMFEAIRDAILQGLELLDGIVADLKASESKTGQTIGNLLETILNVLKWFADPNNWQKVKAGFEALIGVWAAGKVTAAVGHIASFASNMLKIGSGGGTPTSTGGSGGGEALGTAGASAAGGATKAGLGTKLAAGASNLFWTAGVPALVLAAGLLPSYYAQKWNEEQWREEQNERFAAADKIEQMYGGVTANSDFIRRAAEEVGLKHDENGNEKKDFTGNFTQTQNTQDLRTLLMGLSDRQGIQMAQLERDINTYGRYTELGDNTWTLLNRYWNGEAIDAVQENALLETIADAMIKADEARAQHWGLDNFPADSWGNGTGGKDGSSLPKPEEFKKAVSDGVSNIKVTMDGYSVGRIVAPYVSQFIAQDLQ